MTPLGSPRREFPARVLRLHASPRELYAARAYASEAATEFGFDERTRVEFVFAANEAVTNAIVHGTPDSGGFILLRITGEDDQLTLTVFDSGRFIRGATRPDPAAEHGRGHMLIARLMDEFEIQTDSHGTAVRLGKRRRQPAGD